MESRINFLKRLKQFDGFDLADPHILRQIYATGLNMQ